MNRSTPPAVLAAASYTGALWLMVAGIVVVVGLLVGFFIGTRRSSRRQVSTPPPHAAQARPDLTDPARRGEGWSTPDDDPEHGHPHP
ncbi:DUF6479 family protein [Streptomyces sp. NPDC095817]|uniref:DUF6479 family protein n=1 Tax=Streptomyces sp. NPDC095817 TaxID=3155082 RepID=UPI0033193FF3